MPRSFRSQRSYDPTLPEHEFRERVQRLKGLTHDLESLMSLTPSVMKDKLIADIEDTLNSQSQSLMERVRDLEQQLTAANQTIVALTNEAETFRYKSSCVDRLIPKIHTLRRQIVDMKWHMQVDKEELNKILYDWEKSLKEQ